MGAVSIFHLLLHFTRIPLPNILGSGKVWNQQLVHIMVTKAGAVFSK